MFDISSLPFSEEMIIPSEAMFPYLWFQSWDEIIHKLGSGVVFIFPFMWRPKIKRDNQNIKEKKSDVEQKTNLRDTTRLV